MTGQQVTIEDLSRSYQKGIKQVRSSVERSLKRARENDPLKKKIYTPPPKAMRYSFNL